MTICVYTDPANRSEWRGQIESLCHRGSGPTAGSPRMPRSLGDPVFE
jgi:hypothetical protein